MLITIRYDTIRDAILTCARALISQLNLPLKLVFVCFVTSRFVSNTIICLTRVQMRLVCVIFINTYLYFRIEEDYIEMNETGKSPSLFPKRLKSLALPA